MKKLLIAICLLLPFWGLADDTIFIQNLTNAGAAILPVKPGGYFISGTITLRHDLNGNGQTIAYSLTTGNAFLIPAINPNIHFTNCTITGTGNSSNPSGSRGVEYAGDNAVLDHLTINNFTGYGILGSNGLSPTITNCVVSQIGFIGAFLVPTTGTGGLVSHNTFDRSGAVAASVTQGAFMIRGALGDTTSGWIVTHNIFKMPLNPIDASAEDVEIRFISDSRIDSNTFINGSIGLSIVTSKRIHSKGNTYTGQNQEAYEFAATWNSLMENETISSQGKYGILADGTPTNGGSKFDTIRNCNISGTVNHSMFFQGNVHNFYINDNTVSAKTYALYLQQADTFTIVNNTLNGGGVASNPIILNNSIGVITFSCGGVSAFTGKNLFIYGSTPITTNNVNLVNFTSTLSTGYSTNLSGGATVGGSISVAPVVTPVGCSSLLAPNISYTNQTFTALTTISPVTPTNTGGVASVFSISPSIPSGLTYNTSNGVIAGTPTPHQTATTYVVIASNLQGADTTTFTIAINYPAFTFGALPTKIYGAANFAPGATSPATITYTSSNSAVATIISGQIHITGSGSSTITANNTYQTIPQTLTVNKAPLTIIAQNKTKLVGSPNPLLTVGYAGFVLGENNSILTAQPIVTTTAITGSPVGTYPITASSASAANYTIGYAPGTLMVYNAQGPVMYHGRLVHW